jgi:hypothetical protein
MAGSINQFDDDYVLKSGDRILPAEAAAMELVRQHTDIPVPELINSEFDNESGQGYLWMSIIPGRTLDSVWEKLNDATKRRVGHNTWNIIAKIREIRRPPGCRRFFQCSADGSTTLDPLITDMKKPPTPILNDGALRARIYERYLFYAGRLHVEK